MLIARGRDGGYAYAGASKNNTQEIRMARTADPKKREAQN